MATKAKALPEVRQCTDPEDTQFGCTATKAGANHWLVANPEHGGHWAGDEEVKGWAAVNTVKAGGA